MKGMEVMKNTLKRFVIIIAALGVLWSVAVAIDYTRSKAMKPPIFAISSAKSQNGNAYYDCLGYRVYSVAREFNGKEFVVYDMRFSLFGKGNGGRKTIYDNYHQNLGLLGTDKEIALNYLDALKFVTPDVSGEQTTYTEYVNGNDVKVINMMLYNDVVAGFEYEYDNLQAAYDFAKYLRRDLELTFGNKTTYPETVQNGKDYFDSINDISELKVQYIYYEDWKAVFDEEKQKNIDKMLSGKDYSRIDIHFELSVIGANKATVSVRYVAIP